MANSNTLLTDEDDAHGSWKAELCLDFKKTAKKTVLANTHRLGPLTVQRALYPENEVCHVYLLHPPGGVVGGDTLDLTVNLAKNSHVLITTPGATKFYRSAKQAAVVKQVFNLESETILEWLPQENIFFPGALIRATLELNLADSAKAALWEIQCLGRPVIEEVFDQGLLDNNWILKRNEHPLLIERLRINSNNRRRLNMLQNHAVIGTFVVTNITDSLMVKIKDFNLNTNTGYLASTLLDDCLVVRYLGNSTEQAKKYFEKIWMFIREKTLGKESVIPRIWNT